MKKTLEFDGGGFLTLEEESGGISILFQAPYMEKKFRITSMNVKLTFEQAKELTKWLLQIGDNKSNE